MEKSILNVLLGLVLIGVVPAHAALSITCGEGVDAGSMTVEKPLLQIGSTSDTFTGVSGDKSKWSMTYRGQEYPPNRAVASEKRVAHGDVLAQIEILIEAAMTPSGPVGKRLVIENPYDDLPILLEYNMGGFTGPLLLKDYGCVSTQD